MEKTEHKDISEFLGKLKTRTESTVPVRSQGRHAGNFDYGGGAGYFFDSNRFMRSRIGSSVQDAQ